MGIIKQLRDWHGLKGATTPFRDAADSIEALAEALEGVMVYEPEHCACGSRGCDGPREAWGKAREALATVRRKL